MALTLLEEIKLAIDFKKIRLAGQSILITVGFCTIVPAGPYCKNLFEKLKKYGVLQTPRS
jgi:hypothetical protein